MIGLMPGPLTGPADWARDWARVPWVARLRLGRVVHVSTARTPARPGRTEGNPMTLLHRIAAETQTRLHVVREGRDSGQGTLEYVGMIIVAALIAAAVISAAKGVNLGAVFTDKVNSVING